MKQKISTLLIILLVSYGMTLSAQESLTTTGGKTIGNGGTVEYSVGQVFYTTNTGTNGSISQGVQQPYEILVISSIDDKGTIDLSCSAYPNPTTDILTLKVEFNDKHNLQFHLYDIVGNLLEVRRIDSEKTTISMDEYQPSIYILRISDEGKTIKTFKIIKK